MHQLDLLLEPEVEGMIRSGQGLDGSERIVSFQVGNAQIALRRLLDVPSLAQEAHAPVEVVIFSTAGSLYLLSETPHRVRSTG